MNDILKRRIKKLQKKIAEFNKNSAVLLSSNPETYSSLDQKYNFIQNNNFLYLTNSKIKNSLLLICSDKVFLISNSINKNLEIWEGQQENPKAIAKTICSNLILSTTENYFSEVKKIVKGKEILYFENKALSLSWKIAQGFLEMQSFERTNYPATFINADELFSELRLYKDKSEIIAIKKAINITKESLEAASFALTPKYSEKDFQELINFNFGIRGATPAFETIVASGKNAATLHYTKVASKFNARDLVLVDCGAKFENYCADISRCYSVTENFTGIYSDIYEIVLEAQINAINSIKAGVKINTVYMSAVKVLAAGLKSLKVLNGSVDSIIKNKKYLPYFMHSIGHSLGLDVHDLGNLRGSNSATLEAGMVITIEPGLYFNKGTKHIPAGGVRIEDDILVKENGFENLSEGIPK